MSTYLFFGAMICCSALIPQSETFREDIVKGLDTLRNESSDNVLSMSTMAAIANRLSSNHKSVDAVQYMNIIKRQKDAGFRKLAVLTYSFIWKNHISDDSLSKPLMEHGSRDLHEYLVEAIGYQEPENARVMLGQLIDNNAISADLNDKLCELAVIVNMEGIRDKIKDRQNAGALTYGPSVKTWLTMSDAASTRPIEERKAWERAGMVYWRCITGTPPFRSYSSCIWHASRMISREAPEMPISFLEMRIKMNDPVAALTLGLIKGNGATKILAPYVKLTGNMGNAAREALGQIGSTESIRTLEETISPDCDRSVIKDTIRILEKAGDGDTYKLFLSLSADSRYDEDVKTRLKEGASFLKKRIVK